MALRPAPGYFYNQAPAQLPWPWSHDIDRNYGFPAHHYSPSKHYARLALPPHPLISHWPLGQRAVIPGSEISPLQIDNHKFVVHVDVQHFSPDELRVHFTSNNWLVIEGQHEEKADAHGSIERHFKRRYKVPADVNEDDMICQLSRNGILTVYVPREPAKLQEGVKRVIPIQVVDGPTVAVGVGAAVTNGTAK